ncbi:MAG: cysteine hydrolase [Spirochaetes bacterium]|nr:cysteine hydrolase [Spirochaetota bacterium]
MVIKNALVVVDMQKYYIEPQYDFYRYFEERHPGSMNYISSRCKNQVIPNIKKLIDYFKSQHLPVIYLKLASRQEDHKDLHRFFYKEYLKAKQKGYKSLYPLIDEKSSEVVDAIKPANGDSVWVKATFSAFSSTDITQFLEKEKINCLTFCGLATSQCVETTARDASDRGFSTILIDDAQADYSEQIHFASLFASQAVCGAWIASTNDFVKQANQYYEQIIQTEY